MVENEDPRPKRPPEAKISLFLRSDREADQIRLTALRKLQASILLRSQKIGLEGTGLQNCLEDWVNEGYIKAEEQLERWDPQLGDAACWVYLKAKDIAARWFKRYYTEQRKIKELARGGSSLVYDGGKKAGQDAYTVRANRAFIEELLRNDLPLSDARILKLHSKGVGIEEISDLEGLSKGTARRRLNRAQAKAREARTLRETDGLVPRPPARCESPPTKVPNQKRRLTP